MINFYYGNLKDATITEGDVTAKAQYPITNINYLNKNLYTYLDDNDTSGSAQLHEMVMAKVDFGAVQSGIVGGVLDLSSLVISLTSPTYNIQGVSIELQGSTDDASYTGITGSTFYTAGTVGAKTYDVTLTDIYTVTFTAQTYRYWRIILYVEFGDADSVAWDIDGKINNLYIGDYISLPSPELVPFGFNHKAKFSQAYGGSIFGVDTQGQREKWGFNFTNMKEADKTNWKAFDIINKKGVVPCYMESVEGTTQLIDPYFVRVYGGENLKQSAFELYEMNNNVEEEL